MEEKKCCISLNKVLIVEKKITLEKFLEVLVGQKSNWEVKLERILLGFKEKLADSSFLDQLLVPGEILLC